MCSVYLTMAWRNASLDSGDIISPFQVFSFTVQTMSFGPWQVSKRRPKGQLDLCIFGVLISTKSPTFKFWGIKFHFLCVDNSGRYSCFHQTQNIFAAAWIAYHFFLKFPCCRNFMGYISSKTHQLISGLSLVVLSH